MASEPLQGKEEEMATGAWRCDGALLSGGEEHAPGLYWTPLPTAQLLTPGKR
jgi:hypothetical protein